VELAVADRWLNQQHIANVVEVGAVTPYYWPGRVHHVVDPTDAHPGVTVRESIFDVSLVGKTVLSVSTIEHIGLGAYGEGKGSEGADVAAMARIRECTSLGGVLVLTTPYGKAMTDAFSRVYDRAALETLLTGWEILDLTVARRQGPTDWVIDLETTSDQEVDSVALVTARRSG